MEANLHIAEAARRLSVTPSYLRALERQGRIPPARRDFNGRVYTPFDIVMLKRLGIGTRPVRLKTIDEALGPQE